MLVKEKEFLKKKLGKIRNNERLIVARRRRGVTQKQEAKNMDVSLYNYRRWENGIRIPEEMTYELITTLGIFEICYLLRKRNKLSAREVFEAMDISASWLSELERGVVSIGDLVKFWVDWHNETKS